LFTTELNRERQLLILQNNNICIQPITGEQSFSRESRPRHHGSGGGGGGGGGYLGSTLLGRTVMVVCVLSVVAQCVYTLCHDDVSVEIMIFIPPDVKISKCILRITYFLFISNLLCHNFLAESVEYESIHNELNIYCKFVL